MSANGFDPEILQDFLTESGELLEQLEGDLVDLEGTPDDPDLVNQAFRALHTIKGSASFLALGELVEVAHAAESALNAARNAQAQIDNHMMDLLLRAVDSIKVQMGEVGSGSSALSKADPAVVAELSRIGEGRGERGESAPAAETPACAEPIASDSHPEPAADSTGLIERPLEIDPTKADLLEFFVSDLESQLVEVSGLIDDLADSDSRVNVVAGFAKIGTDLAATIGFFDVDPMVRLNDGLGAAAAKAADLPDEILDQLLPRFRAVVSLLTEQVGGVKASRILERPVGTLLDRIGHLAGGNEPDADWVLPSGVSIDGILELDGVMSGGGSPSEQIAPAAPAGVEAVRSDAVESPVESDDTPTPPAAGPRASGKPAERAVSTPEATIRVEVGRLESLMNLVGELVLQKNRITEIAGHVSQSGHVENDINEQFSLATEGLCRVTGDIQVAVMRTRMQPLDKLFGKYPRLIRDLAQKTGKKIRLVVEGGETEVDRSVIEELGDPLIHLMRNSADHGLEGPEERSAAGKSETGTIVLRAAQQGDHVLIEIIDDGRGLNRERIGAKAVERGMVTAAEVEALSDDEVANFIFLPGFSTAGEVSDLSGRGVGMDVVRTNINKIKGTIGVKSRAGEGTTISISIPLTVAIMPAMMVSISDEIYAVPLGSIIEIVRPGEEQMSTIINDRVLRVREQVIPLVDANDVFGVPESRRRESAMALVLSAGTREVGLLVSGVIGQQEIVIKPLEGIEQTGPVSGATVRNDGGVSLILDVAAFVRCAESAAAARSSGVATVN